MCRCSATEIDFGLDVERLHRVRQAAQRGASPKKHTGKAASRIRGLDFEYDDDLWMPVRVSAQGQNLFACGGWAHPRIPSIHGPGDKMFPPRHPSCPWMWAPAVLLATSGILALRHAERCGEASITFPYELGTLRFRKHDADIAVHWSRTDRTISAHSTDVLAAWERFGDRLREELLQALPELSGHRP
jgi:hypothetical protein